MLRMFTRLQYCFIKTLSASQWSSVLYQPHMQPSVCMSSTADSCRIIGAGSMYFGGCLRSQLLLEPSVRAVSRCLYGTKPGAKSGFCLNCRNSRRRVPPVVSYIIVQITRARATITIIVKIATGPDREQGNTRHAPGVPLRHALLSVRRLTAAGGVPPPALRR